MICDMLVSVDCCDDGIRVIEVRKADECYGPEHDGPSIMYVTVHGEEFYRNVNFCPFCGAELVYNEEGFWIVPRKGN